MSFITHQGFPGGSNGKESAYNARDPTSIPGLGRSPGEGNGNPLQYSCLENSTDRGASLMDYCVWGQKELDTNEWPTHFWYTQDSQKMYLLKMAEFLTHEKVKIFNMHRELQFIGLCFLRTERVTSLDF